MSALRGTVVAQLRSARKYRHLCDDTLNRMADWALVRHPSAKAAVKAAKRKLHQVYGVYADTVDADAITGAIRRMGDDPRPECAEILRHHVSTAERLHILDDVYAALWERTGKPRSVMDLACGLHPFSLPWMGLNEVRYIACDIDLRVVNCIAAFFGVLGIDGTADCRDLLVNTPQEEADVALILKTLPCLEQQEKDAAYRLLADIRAEKVVVSFPARSIGGRDRGMERHYEDVIQRLVARLTWKIDLLSFPSEVFYVLSR